MFIFWGELNDECSFLDFSIALNRKVHKNVKDFYSNNDFFLIIVYFYLINFCIHESGYPNFDLFQHWVCGQNWPKLLKGVENKYFCPLSIHLFRYQNIIAIADEVDTIVIA